MVWKVSHCFCINPLCNIWKRDRESTQRRWADFYACGSPMPPGPSRSTFRGGMACVRSVGPSSLRSPRLSQSVELREVKGVRGDLEALPARVGPWPTLLLQLISDFSAPFVSIRDLEWQGWKISGLRWAVSLGTVQQWVWSPGWTILSQKPTTPQGPCCTDLSLLSTSKGKTSFFLKPSHKIFSWLWVFLSVPVHLSREISLV